MYLWVSVRWIDGRLINRELQNSRDFWEDREMRMCCMENWKTRVTGRDRFENLFPLVGGGGPTLKRM